VTDILDIEPEPNPAALTIEKMRRAVMLLRRVPPWDGTIIDPGGRIGRALFRIERAAFRRRFIRRYRRGAP
jgi:hypothetical protein